MPVSIAYGGSAPRWAATPWWQQGHPGTACASASSVAVFAGVQRQHPPRVPGRVDVTDRADDEVGLHAELCGHTGVVLAGPLLHVGPGQPHGQLL